MNCYDCSLCTFYGSLWLFLLESYTPGQVSTRMFNAVHTIACLSMMLCIETCTLLYHIMAANWPANRQSNWQANRPAKCYVLVCTCMYWHVLSCTVSWYVQVCTSMNQYVLVCTGLYSTLLRLLSVSTQGFMVSTAKLPGCLLLQRC